MLTEDAIINLLSMAGEKHFVVSSQSVLLSVFVFQTATSLKCFRIVQSGLRDVIIFENQLQ